MRVRLPLRSALAALLVLGLAGAASADDFDRPGFYLGGSAVYGFNVFEDEIEDVVGVSVDVDDSFGANGRVGYRALSFFALELEYEWVDGFDIELAGIDIGKLESHALTLNTKWIVPTWRVQPYLLVGAGGNLYRFDDKTGVLGNQNEYGFAGRVGGGLDVYLTKSIVLNAEATALLSTADFDTPFGTVDNVFYLSGSAGFQYRF